MSASSHVATLDMRTTFLFDFCVNTHHIFDKFWECWNKTVPLHCTESIFDFSGHLKSFRLYVPALGEFGQLVLEHNSCHHSLVSHVVTR